MSLELVRGRVETPLGRFGLLLSPYGICRLTLPNEPEETCELWAKKRMAGARLVWDEAVSRPVVDELVAYAAGEINSFATPVDMYGTTFQRDVWDVLKRIPYGGLRSYAQVATAVGRPSAVRAVGAAIGANPVPIIVPCHRVIGSDGGLTGFLGGLELKRRLLEMEGAIDRTRSG